MAVSVLTTGENYYNQFKNGINFTLNLGDSTPNLVGEIMDKIKVIKQVDISWKDSSSKANLFTYKDAAKSLVRDSGSWIDERFSIGDHIAIAYIDDTGAWFGTYEADITNLSDRVMITVLSIQIPAGAVLADGNYSIMTVYGRTPLTALIYGFGLIENSENFNIISKVSGNDQSYYGSNIGFDTGGGIRSTSWVDLISLGQYKDWVTGTARIRYVSNPDANTQRFVIEHTFIIPFYIEGELTNLQNNIIPTILNGQNSLKYVYDLDFRLTLSNPNSKKYVKNDSSLGSVAWFRGNFNDYKIDTVLYQDAATLATANGILIGSKTKISVFISRISGTPIAVGETFGVSISYLPELSETQNKITPFIENYIFDNTLNVEGGVAVTGNDFITSLTGASIVGGRLIIICEVLYNLSEQVFLMSKLLQNKANFLIGVEIGDNTLSSGNANKVMLPITGVYDESADISGLVKEFIPTIFPYGNKFAGGIAYTDLKAWNEHNFAIKGTFEIELTLAAFINSFDISIIAYKSDTDWFELDKYEFQLSYVLMNNGTYNYQFFNILDDRNYPLTAGNEKTVVKLSTDILAAGKTLVLHRFEIGQKISWEDWIANANVNNIFLDISKPNNNKNLKTSNYSNLNGYQIKIKYRLNMAGTNSLGNTGNTDYVFLSPDISVYDYDKDKNAVPNFTSIIETFDATGTINLGGTILTGQDTLMKITWTQAVVDILDISGYWAVHRIEEVNEISKNIHELSSFELPPANNFLKPFTGNFLSLTLIGGKLVTTCLIDGNQIDVNKKYNLSGEINNLNKLA